MSANIYFKAFLAILFTCHSFSMMGQHYSPSLDDFKKVVDNLDSTTSKNFHMVVSGGFDEKTASLEVWITDKLGDSKLGPKLNICEFFSYRNSKVYVYLPKKCNNKVPEIHLRDADEHSFQSSPFYEGVKPRIRLLLQKSDDNLMIWRMELLNYKEVRDKTIEEFIEK